MALTSSCSKSGNKRVFCKANGKASVTWGNSTTAERTMTEGTIISCCRRAASILILPSPRRRRRRSSGETQMASEEAAPRCSSHSRSKLSTVTLRVTSSSAAAKKVTQSVCSLINWPEKWPWRTSNLSATSFPSLSLRSPSKATSSSPPTATSTSTTRYSSFTTCLLGANSQAVASPSRSRPLPSARPGTLAALKTCTDCGRLPGSITRSRPSNRFKTAMSPSKCTTTA